MSLDIENVSSWLLYMLEATPQEWDNCNEDQFLRNKINLHCRELVKNTYEKKSMVGLVNLHKALGMIYDHYFNGVRLESADCESQPILRDIAAILEAGMLGHEYSLVLPSQLENMPVEGTLYVKWLKKIISEHTSSVHPLYNNFIADQANEKHLALYLAQETNLDPRFDDILALLQIGLDVAPKLVLANNYYDEMGNGNSRQVHSHMFKEALKSVGVDEKFLKENMLLEAKISGNLSAALALSRRHYFKAVGYFGVTEYLAPRRFKHVVNAWRRNGLPEIGIAYHNLHITIDAIHANDWFNNVVVPAVDKNSDAGREIAIGALVRLNSSEHYLDALLQKLSPKYLTEVI